MYIYTSLLRGRRIWLKLPNTLHVLEARGGLVSLGRINAAGGHVVFSNGWMVLCDSANNVIVVAHTHKGLYYLNVQTEIHHPANDGR